MISKKEVEIAFFGAGCFWHVEEMFRCQPGVLNTLVGYMGGKFPNPTYDDVCSDKTGHVEVCQIEFDPSKVTYEKLLKLFWKIHDPTQLNRQGLDIGTQYKSVIFYRDNYQRLIAIDSKNNVQKKYKKDIVTEIIPEAKFYLAEEYHQKYLVKKGSKYCDIF